MEIEKITQKAMDLREKYNPKDFVPFPYRDIESGEGNLNILFSDIKRDDTFGAISFDENKFVIYINDNIPDSHKNFAIAHELGHYFLHKNIILGNKEKAIVDFGSFLGKKTLFQRSSNVSDAIEKQADMFAMELLMPEKAVVSVWDILDKDIKGTAKVFNVPVSRMTIRLENLGLIDEE